MLIKKDPITAKIFQDIAREESLHITIAKEFYPLETDKFKEAKFLDLKIRELRSLRSIS